MSSKSIHIQIFGLRQVTASNRQDKVKGPFSVAVCIRRGSLRSFLATLHLPVRVRVFPFWMTANSRVAGLFVCCRFIVCFLCKSAIESLLFRK